MKVIGQPFLTPIHYGAGALLMGTSIAVMHYSGMAAIQSVAALYYDPLWFAVSIAIAIVASLVALVVAVAFRHLRGMKALVLKTASALLMGVAIAGMHYTGMAATFLVVPADALLLPPAGSQSLALGVAIGVVSLLIIAVGLVVSQFDRQVEAKEAAIRRMEALLHAQLDREARYVDEETGLYTPTALTRFLELQQRRRRLRETVLLVRVANRAALEQQYSAAIVATLYQMFRQNLQTLCSNTDAMAAMMSPDQYCLVLPKAVKLTAFVQRLLTEANPKAATADAASALVLQVQSQDLTLTNALPPWLQPFAHEEPAVAHALSPKA